jgi:hypothetical protein
METAPLQENTTIYIKATNIFTNQFAELNQKVFVLVRPNLVLKVQLKDTIIDYGNDGNIMLDSSQASVKYQLLITEIDYEQAGITQPLEYGDPVVGNGKSLNLSLKGLKEDNTFMLVAFKNEINEKGLVINGLTQLVRPDTSLSVDRDAVDNEMIVLKTTQVGVKYQLVNDVDSTLVGKPVYHHKNKGLAKGKIGVDFVVNTFEGDPIKLPTGKLTKDTTFKIKAIKQATSVDVFLLQKITLKKS